MALFTIDPATGKLVPQGPEEAIQPPMAPPGPPQTPSMPAPPPPEPSQASQAPQGAPQGAGGPPGAPPMPPGPPPAAPGPQDWQNPAPNPVYQRLQAKFGSENPELGDEALKRAQDHDWMSSVANRMGNNMLNPMMQAAGMQPFEMKGDPSSVAQLGERRKLLADKLGVENTMQTMAGQEQERALKVKTAGEGRDPESGRSKAARATRDMLLQVLAKAGIDPVKAGIPMDPAATAEQLDPYLKDLLGAGVAQGQLAASVANREALMGQKGADKKTEYAKATQGPPGYTWGGAPGSYPEEKSKAAFTELHAEHEQRQDKVRALQTAVAQAAKSGAAADREKVREARNGLVQFELSSAKVRMNPTTAELVGSRIPEFITMDNMKNLAGGGWAKAGAAYNTKLEHWLAGEGSTVDAAARAAGFTKSGPKASAPGGHGAPTVVETRTSKDGTTKLEKLSDGTIRKSPMKGAH